MQTVPTPPAFDTHPLLTNVQQWEFERSQQIFGHRHGGAGIRRAARQPSSVLDAILSASAGTMVLRYDAEHFTLGTPPDVAGAPNRGSFGAAADIAQAVESQRPHSAGAGVSSVFELVNADSKFLTAAGIEAFAKTGDTITLFCVAKPTSGNNYMAVVQSGSFGIALLATDVLLNTRVVTVSTGFTNNNRSYMASDALQLFEGRIEAGRVVSAVDGVESEAVASTGGVDGDQVNVSIGRSIGSGAYWDDDVAFMALLVNASPAVSDATRVAIQNTYPTPALP